MTPNIENEKPLLSYSKGASQPRFSVLAIVGFCCGLLSLPCLMIPLVRPLEMLGLIFSSAWILFYTLIFIAFWIL